MTNMPPASSENPVVQLGATFKQIVASPNEFFSNLPQEDGIKHAAIFYAAIWAVNVGGTLIVTMRPGQALMTLVVDLCFALVWTGYVHWVSKLMGGNRGFPQTFRAMSFASAPLVFAWLPLINLIAGAYTFYLMTLGLERVQELPSKRAMVVIGSATLFMVFLCIAYALLKLSALLKPSSSSNF